MTQTQDQLLSKRTKTVFKHQTLYTLDRILSNSRLVANGSRNVSPRNDVVADIANSSDLADLDSRVINNFFEDEICTPPP